MSSLTADGFVASASLADVAHRAARYAAWRRHSSRIHVWRKVLPAIIGAVILVLGGWVAYSTVASRVTGQDEGRISIRLLNPKFFGRSDAGSPFVISARSAVRSDSDFKRVALDAPVFVQHLNTPAEVELRAARGVYHEGSRVLRLNDELVLNDKRGYRFEAQSAVVHTNTGAVIGQSPIKGRGPLGQIAASSYSIVGGGERMFFRGNVRSRIEQSPR